MNQSNPVTIYDTLLSMADNMASAATSFNSQGYDIFITARENFQDALRKISIEHTKGLDWEVY